MSGESQKTTEHEVIRRWAENRDGEPAAVKATGDSDDPGILRIMFRAGEREDDLEPIPWDEFFRKFEESKLAFLYQDRTKDGELSRFFKFVSR